MKWLIPAIGIPVLLIVIVWLAWRNMEKKEAEKRKRRAEFRKQSDERARAAIPAIDEMSPAAQAFSKALTLQLKSVLEQIEQNSNVQGPYGFAICLDDDIASYYFASNSENDIQNALRTRSEKSGKPVNELHVDLYDVTHWRTESDLAIPEEIVNHFLKSCVTRKDRFDSFARGLADFKTQGGFASYEHLPNFFAGIWIHDSENEDWMFEVARQLSSRDNANQFASENFGPKFLAKHV